MHVHDALLSGSARGEASRGEASRGGVKGIPATCGAVHQAPRFPSPLMCRCILSLIYLLRLPILLWATATFPRGEFAFCWVTASYM